MEHLTLDPRIICPSKPYCRCRIYRVTGYRYTFCLFFPEPFSRWWCLLWDSRSFPSFFWAAFSWAIFSRCCTFHDMPFVYKLLSISSGFPHCLPASDVSKLSKYGNPLADIGTSSSPDKKIAIRLFLCWKKSSFVPNFWYKPDFRWGVRSEISWVTQKLPQIYTSNHATFPIQIRKITVKIFGNFWVTQ